MEQLSSILRVSKRKNVCELYIFVMNLLTEVVQTVVQTVEVVQMVVVIYVYLYITCQDVYVILNRLQVYSRLLKY